MMRLARMLVRCVTAAAVAWTAACGDASERPGPDGAAAAVVVRVGHFPNVTHAHGLVAHAMSRSGDGWFEKRLGPGVSVQWFSYNAGPSEMEALLADSIDLGYVGPNPALNAHLRSKGTDIRVLAGATRGGAALVVQGDGRIATAADFKGRRVATPQLGNTQDVACRAWLRSNGFAVTQTGGDVTVLPTQNPDQLALFKTGDLDAVWTVEPWVSRLEREAGGKVLVSEDDAITTVLVASERFVAGKPDLARKFTAAHRELTEWIAAHPEDAKRLVRDELKALTRQEMPPDLLDHCWPRMRLDAAIAVSDFEKFVKAAQSVGFLNDAGDLGRLVQDLK